MTSKSPCLETSPNGCEDLKIMGSWALISEWYLIGKIPRSNTHFLEHVYTSSFLFFFLSLYLPLGIEKPIIIVQLYTAEIGEHNLSVWTCSLITISI